MNTTSARLLDPVSNRLDMPATKLPRAVYASARLYREIAEASPDQIFIVDGKNVFEYVNPAAAQALCLNGPGVGRQVSDCFPTGIGKGLEYEINRARRTQAPTYSERQVTFLNGSPRWMSAWLTPIEGADGNKTTVVGVARDMTQKHELGELLQRQHQLMNAVVDGSPIGIMLLDCSSQWTCEFANPVMQEMACKQDINGTALTEAWPSLASALDQTLTVLAAHGQPQTIELTLPGRTRSGGPTMIHVSVTASRVQLPDRSGHQVLLLATDITDRRQLEQQVLQADKIDAVGRLAGGIAHDFNNLLTPILGYTEIVLGTMKNDDPRRADLEEVHHAAQSAASLTLQLLTFSRKQHIQPTVLDLNEVVHSVHGIVRRTIGEDVHVVVDCAEGLDHVMADRSQMEQVIMNLCVNARDAMPDGGVLAIRTFNTTLSEDTKGALRTIPPGRYSALTLADTGTGMTPEVLAHVFEPFFTTKGVGKGTGLGLSNVYGIVRQAGGYVAVDTLSGEGTAFTIYLPRTEAVGPSASEASRIIPSRMAQGDETVLVVDDNDGIRRLAERLLNAAGYRILVASNVAEALYLSETFKGTIHLLLSDIVMPDADGLMLAQQMAVQRPEMRTLFMSGYAGKHVATHGTLKSGTPLLQKPFARDTLTRAVRQALDGGFTGVDSDTQVSE